MRLTLGLATALILGGCAQPSGVINLEVPNAGSSVVLIDERPDDEKDGVLSASCVNQGERWSGIKDSAFATSRITLLKARLANAFGDTISEVKVRHFQNCAQVNSQSGAAALAGVSYALAVVVDGMYKRGQDLIKTYIDVVIDGQRLNAYDMRPYRQGAILLQEDTVGVVIRSTDAAIDQLVSKLRDRLATKQ